MPKYVADKIRPGNTLVPYTSLAAALSSGGIIVFCLLYGFFSGAFVSLNPAVAVSLCRDLGSLGNRMSMICIPLSVGLLIGNPIAGSLIRYGCVAVQVFCGTSIFIAAICFDCNSAHETQKYVIGGEKAHKIRLSTDQSLIVYVTFRCERDVQCSLYPVLHITSASNIEIP